MLFIPLDELGVDVETCHLVKIVPSHEMQCSNVVVFLLKFGRRFGKHYFLDAWKISEWWLMSKYEYSGFERRQHITIKWLYGYRNVSFYVPGGRFKNTYELLNLRALKISKLHKNHIFQCMGKIFCVEFQRVPLKFHTKYLTHTLKDVDFIHILKFKSS